MGHTPLHNVMHSISAKDNAHLRSEFTIGDFDQIAMLWQQCKQIKVPVAPGGLLAVPYWLLLLLFGAVSCTVSIECWLRLIWGFAS